MIQRLETAVELHMSKTVCVFAAMVFVASSAFGAIIYSENFDSYNPGGRPPSGHGWWFSNNNTGYVGDTHSLSAPHSLASEIVDGYGVTATLTPADTVIAGSYSFAIYLEHSPSSNTIVSFNMYSDVGLCVNLWIGTSYIGDYGPDGEINTEVALDSNQWYDIEISFDHVLQTYDLIIDGDKKWTKGLIGNGQSTYSSAYYFANNAYGDKYYDNIQLSECEPGLATRSLVIDALWKTGFDEEYLIGDWMDHEATYTGMGWNTHGGTGTGDMDIIDSGTYIREGLEHVTPASTPQCFRFIKDVFVDRFLKRSLPAGGEDNGDTYMAKGLISWSFFMADDVFMESVFTLEGHDTDGSSDWLFEFWFVNDEGEGQVHDFTDGVTYTGSKYDLDQWHNVVVEFDCVSGTYSLYLDEKVIIADKQMRFAGHLASSAKWGASQNSESFIDDIAIGMEFVPDPYELRKATLKPEGAELEFYPAAIEGQLRCIMWKDDLMDTWNIGRKFRTDENYDTSWLDSALLQDWCHRPGTAG